MTYGLGRAEILSAQANGVTLLVLACLIVYGAITRLVSPPHVHGLVVLVVALAGMAWMSRISEGTAYFPGIVVPLMLLGIGVFVFVVRGGVSVIRMPVFGACLVPMRRRRL